MKKNFNSLFNKLIQVGFVVKNLQKTMDKFLNIYGVGPWYVIEFNNKNVENMQLYCSKKNYSMLVGVCPIRDVRFEIIEPISESIYSEYLDKYGEGIIHHAKLNVDNYLKSLEYFESKGFKVIQHGEQLGVNGKNKYTYLDTSKSLGFISEIADASKDFIKPEPDYWYPTEHIKGLESIFIRPTQIGIVVKDLEKKVNEITDIFKLSLIALKDYSNKNISNMYIHGKFQEYSMKIAFFNLGNVTLKIIEPLDQSIFTEFHTDYQEGIIHHIRMEVKDYNQAINFIKSQNIKILQSGLFNDQVNFAFIKTNQDINFITEIIENSNEEIAKFCP